MNHVDLVASYLRGQNLEQLGRTDEAVELYELVVAAAFDAAGPYDRLLRIYGSQARHGEVVRVATSALENVQTHEPKRDWYRRIRSEAQEASRRLPRAAHKRREEPP